MAADWNDSEEEGVDDRAVDVAEGADGWVDGPVREAPDAPLVRTEQSPGPSSGPSFGQSSERPPNQSPDQPPDPTDPTDDLWTMKNVAPQSASGLSVPHPPGEPKPKPKPEPLSDIDSGRAMAIFAHSSVVLGLPVFLIPLISRDNAFALHHAKAAGVNFAALVLFAILTVLTGGLALPLIFVCYLPALVGVVNAANGDEANSWALGGLGESIFSAFRAK